MKQGLFILVCGLLAAGLTGCDDSSERRARYAEKKPAPRPLERTFDPPKKVLPPAKPKKKAPVWMDYKGEDMRQLTELSGRKVLLVFYASWSRPAMDYVQAVKSYAESQDGKAFAVLIDADAYPDIARKYGLEAVPLTVLYLEGMKLKDMVGGITAPRLNELIEGWIIAMQQMCIGDKWEIYIPAEMGYGKFSQPGIPGGSTLIFEIELFGIA